MSIEHNYIPALGDPRLTPYYDLLMKWAFPEQRFKHELIRQARIRPGHTVVDLGCGTATLALMVAQEIPGAVVVGTDIDGDILAIGRRKIRRAGLATALVCNGADAVPLATSCCDRVLSTLVIHHLDTEAKLRALSEVFRLLRPGGELHIADFGPPNSIYAHMSAAIGRHLEQAHDNLAGELPAMMGEAGFIDVMVVGHRTTIVGDLAFYRAAKPERTSSEE